MCIWIIKEKTKNQHLRLATKLSITTYSHSFVFQHSKNRLTFCIFIVLVVLVKLCNTENLSPQQTKQNPRRHVRLVIRNSPITRSTDNILMRYARERDRTLVRVIRTKRRKRNKDVLHIAPTHMRTVRLKSKTGFFLEIQPSGKVTGHVNKTKYSKLNLSIFTHLLSILFEDLSLYLLTPSHFPGGMAKYTRILKFRRWITWVFKL